MKINRIAELRNQQGLTLKQLGAAVGLKDNTLNQYEKDKREPKLETWKKLADYFGVSVGYIQGVSDNSSISIFDSSFETKLLDYFKELATKAFAEVLAERSNQDEYLTKAEAAKLLKCSEKTVKKLVDDYALPEIRADHFIRYKRTDVEELMERLRC